MGKGSNVHAACWKDRERPPNGSALLRTHTHTEFICLKGFWKPQTARHESEGGRAGGPRAAPLQQPFCAPPPPPTHTFCCFRLLGPHSSCVTAISLAPIQVHTSTHRPPPRLSSHSAPLMAMAYREEERSLDLQNTFYLAVTFSAFQQILGRSEKFGLSV